MAANNSKPIADQEPTPEYAEAMSQEQEPTVFTWINNKRSFCESCDTSKTNVRWWAFQGGPPFSIETTERPNHTHTVNSACKACMKYIPKQYKDMPLSW